MMEPIVRITKLSAQYFYTDDEKFSHENIKSRNEFTRGSPHKEHSFVRVIGQGTFGIVNETLKSNGKRRAIKLIDGSDGSAHREIATLTNRRDDCKFVVKYYDSWIFNSEGVMDEWKRKFFIPKWAIAIELELCEGDMRSYIEERNDLFKRYPNDCHMLTKMNENIEISFQHISHGLQHLHKNSLIHRDLKPANILYDRHMTWKISDFGLSRYLYSDLSDEKMIGQKISKDNLGSSFTAGVGSRLYSAPEVYGNEYTKKVDIFSFGLVIIEASHYLIESSDRARCFEKFKNGEIYPEGIVVDACKHWLPMARNMIHQEPERRPIADEITKFSVIRH